MSEQLVCYNLLQDQRKATVEMYLFNMTILANAVLEIDEAEKFVDGTRDALLPRNGLMMGYIRAVEEKYPHVAIPSYKVEEDFSYTVKCKLCGVSLGWFCPDNPAGYCVYDYKNRFGQDREWCIHCESPEERK